MINQVFKFRFGKVTHRRVCRLWAGCHTEGPLDHDPERPDHVLRHVARPRRQARSYFLGTTSAAKPKTDEL